MLELQSVLQFPRNYTLPSFAIIAGPSQERRVLDIALESVSLAGIRIECGHHTSGNFEYFSFGSRSAQRWQRGMWPMGM